MDIIWKTFWLLSLVFVSAKWGYSRVCHFLTVEEWEEALCKNLKKSVTMSFKALKNKNKKLFTRVKQSVYILKINVQYYKFTDTKIPDSTAVLTGTSGVHCAMMKNSVQKPDTSADVRKQLRLRAKLTTMAWILFKCSTSQNIHSSHVVFLVSCGVERRKSIHKSMKIFDH